MTTNEAERKIARALDSAVQLKNSGSAPDDCLIKAASMHDLNPDMTERLVEAFNIALTNSTIRKLGDKTASFPIASKSAVLSGVFDRLAPADKSKTASSAEEDFFRISHKPVLLGWDATGTALAKTARLESVMISQAHGACDRLHSGLSKLAQDKMAAELKVNDAYADLCNHLVTSDNLHKFAGLEHQALSEYGDSIKPLLDELYSSTRLDKFKVARFSGTVEKVEYFQKSAGWDLLQGFVSSVQALDEAAGKHSKEAAVVQQQIGETHGLIHVLNGGKDPEPKCAADLLTGNGDFFLKKAEEDDVQPSSGVDAVGMVSKAVASPFDRGNNFVSSIQGGVAGALSETYQKAHAEAQKNKLRGPKDEADMERSNLIRQRILAELVNGDEIISRMPHTDVEHSYSSLLSLAPDLTLDHNVVRGWLRNSAATQALDPFTAGQLIKTQQDSQKNKLLSSGQLKPAA